MPWSFAQIACRLPWQSCEFLFVPTKDCACRAKRNQWLAVFQFQNKCCVQREASKLVFFQFVDSSLVFCIALELVWLRIWVASSLVCFHDHMMFRFIMFLVGRTYAEEVRESKWKEIKGYWKDDGRKLKREWRENERTWEKNERNEKMMKGKWDENEKIMNGKWEEHEKHEKRMKR